jgi:hypothetical protein
MTDPTLPNLISVSQMFLVPSSILFGALGVAPTEPLKTLISFLGSITSLIWFYRVLESTGAAPIDWGTTLALAGIFAATWLISLGAHGWAWAHPPSVDRADTIDLHMEGKATLRGTVSN